MTIRYKTQAGFKEGRGYGKDDWDAVDSPELTDEELARARPAKTVLPPEFFKAVEEERRTRGRPPVDKPKKLVTLRLDPDVIDKFEATGKGWRSRMNEALRRADPNAL